MALDMIPILTTTLSAVVNSNIDKLEFNINIVLRLSQVFNAALMITLMFH